MKKIVIIGGGFTGTRCARKLQKKFLVTLIDCKPYFEYTPSILKTILKPKHSKKIQRLHKDYLKIAEIIEDEVVSITNNDVTTKKGKEIPFDYLIIASGSSYAIPIKQKGLVPATRAKELMKYHNDIEKVENILIIGGGLVGVELAAEIITYYDKKKVTIVHPHKELMERNNPRSRKYAEHFLRKNGVKIILNERIEKAEGPSGRKKRYKTNRGTNISADFSFITVGIIPNYKFMKKTFLKKLGKKKYIKVNEYLQLPGYKNIFVGGDITAIKEEKTAQTAEKHADIIVKNIKNLEKPKPLITYETKKRPMVVSLGKFNGIFEYKKIVLVGIIPAFLKWYIERKTMRKH